VRGLLFLLELAIVLAVAYLAYRGIAALSAGRRLALPAPARPAEGGRWQTHHYVYAGHTVVSVARLTPAGEVVEEHVVTRIPDSDPDWSRKFLAAREEAEERAFHLNAE
jgi:pyridoxamine 5'-phosphate oxidase family protein